MSISKNVTKVYDLAGLPATDLRVLRVPQIPIQPSRPPLYIVPPPATEAPSARISPLWLPLVMAMGIVLGPGDTPMRRHPELADLPPMDAESLSPEEIRRRREELEAELAWIEDERRRLMLNGDYPAAQRFNLRLQQLGEELGALPRVANHSRPTIVDSDTTGGPATAAPASSDAPSETADATPTDWENLAQTDKVGFLRAVRKWDFDSRRAIFVRITGGSSALEVSVWYSSEIWPVYDRIRQLIRGTPNWPPERQGLVHDLGNRLLIYTLIDAYLEEGTLSKVETLCDLSWDNLGAAFQFLQAELDPLCIKSSAVQGLHLSPDISPSLVVGIFRNILSNAAQHAGKDPVMVVVTHRGKTLEFKDNGAGMSPESLDAIRKGRRIHNDAAVDPDDPDQNHGLGWESIRESCRRLGIQWAINSEEGKGTTVTLTLPDGFLKLPDPH